MTTNPLGEMPFLHHLAELRTRIMRALIAVCVGTCITYSWAGEIMHLLTAPIRHSFPDLQLIGTGPAEAFLCRLQVAIASGIVLACPVAFFQLWLFVAPGLHEHERRLAVPFVSCSTVFFLSGVLFCYALVLPIAFSFFSDEFTSLGLKPDIRIGEYLPFMLKLLLVFGTIFEFPIVAYFLARGGLLRSEWLKSQVRYAILVIFVLAGILTPPDVISQLLLAGPLLVIYALCFGICRWVEKGNERKAPASSSADTSP